MIAAARRRRALGVPRWLPRRRARLAVVLLVLAVVLAGAYVWLRDSSLVSVERVRITGLATPDAPQIRSALQSAARGMTTLDVRENTLRAAVSPYPVVKRLSVSTHFPHGLTIHVIEQVPVASVTVAGRTVALAADGTLLRDMQTGTLPAITLRAAPGGQRVQDPSALAELALLGQAPAELLSRVASVATDPVHGLVAQLRQGPSIRFGDASRPRAKWLAVVALLAQSQDAGAAYIDVTDPQRPAAGTIADAGTIASAGGAASPTSAAPGLPTPTAGGTSASSGTTSAGSGTTSTSSGASSLSGAASPAPASAPAATSGAGAAGTPATSGGPVGATSTPAASGTGGTSPGG